MQKINCVYMIDKGNATFSSIEYGSNSVFFSLQTCGMNTYLLSLYFNVTVPAITAVICAKGCMRRV